MGIADWSNKVDKPEIIVRYTEMICSVRFNI